MALDTPCSTVICSQCGEPFCPNCDLPPGIREGAHIVPILCGICLDSTHYPRSENMAEEKKYKVVILHAKYNPDRRVARIEFEKDNVTEVVDLLQKAGFEVEIRMPGW